MHLPKAKVLTLWDSGAGSISEQQPSPVESKVALHAALQITLAFS